MSKISLAKFHIYTPNVVIAKKIFNKDLGLEIIKESVLPNNLGVVSFKLGDTIRLSCWEFNHDSKRINAYSDSISLFSFNAYTAKTCY